MTNSILVRKKGKTEGNMDDDKNLNTSIMTGRTTWAALRIV